MGKIIRIAKGYAIGLFIFFFLSFIGAAILKWMPFKQSWSFFYLLFAMTAASLFLCGYMGNFFQKRGMLCGLLFSTTLIILILVLTCLGFSATLHVEMLSPLYLIPVGAGVLGGIIGTNLAK